MDLENLKQQVDELQLNTDLLTSDIARMLPTIIGFLDENEKLLQGFHEVREKDLETKSKLIDYIKDCNTAVDNYVRDYGNLQGLTVAYICSIRGIMRIDYSLLTTRIYPIVYIPGKRYH